MFKGIGVKSYCGDSGDILAILRYIDILEKGEIVTYREAEHDMLMEIRNGKFLDSNRQPIEEFFELVEGYKTRLEYAKENTDLPDQPDYRGIKDFMMSVNERVILGSV